MDAEKIYDDNKEDVLETMRLWIKASDDACEPLRAIIMSDNSLAEFTFLRKNCGEIGFDVFEFEGIPIVSHNGLALGEIEFDFYGEAGTA